MTARIIVGDVTESLRTLPDESVQAIVTDPPYDLSFMGKAWDGTGVAFRPETWADALRVAAPGAHLLAFGGTRTFHRLTCAIEDAGWQVRDCLMWLYGSGFPKSLDVSKAIDKAAGVQREVVGRRSGALNNADHSTASSFTKGAVGWKPEFDITLSATDAARIWSGWGTALKPAWEPIILARKPLIGTVAANVQTHGTGALNVDGCRIGTNELAAHGGGRNGAGRICGMGAGVPALEPGANPHIGRWPANVALDEDAAAQLDRMSGEGAAGAYPSKGARFGYSGGERKQIGFRVAMNSGGASRFFYTSKASQADRDRDLGNKHPTVKPVDLMRWLVRLVTPPGGTVLDPFTGSGSTGVAVIGEGFDFIGIDADPESCETARKRLETVAPLLSETTVAPVEEAQAGMFNS